MSVYAADPGKTIYFHDEDDDPRWCDSNGMYPFIGEFSRIYSDVTNTGPDSEWHSTSTADYMGNGDKPTIQRDYTWFGPTASDGKVKWDEGLKGWAVDAGSHVVYPTLKTEEYNPGFQNPRIYQWDSSSRDYIVHPDYAWFATKQVWSGRYIATTGLYEVPYLRQLIPGTKLEDKIYATNGGTIASVEQSDKGMRGYGKSTETHTYSTKFGGFYDEDREREYLKSCCPVWPSLTGINFQKVFSYQRQVVTVTGTGGASVSSNIQEVLV